MSSNQETLSLRLQEALADRLLKRTERLGEVTVEVGAKHLREVMLILRDHRGLEFDQLIDLCGMDYSTYGDGRWEGKRFAVVYHLLSVRNNQRVRVRVFAEDDDFPLVATVVDIWPVANWFEREAFDLFGILFEGHPDLRRILTDYGFIGHPFRKDFPLSGNVEVRYDPEEGRVVYQPVTVEPREITPRIVREGNYGG
ncbi:MAG: NADH-quinone oxidoreductase subunit C [Sulfuricellaceae bacterium]|jgi:NADH-quinone oxidoreductase subunit C